MKSISYFAVAVCIVTIFLIGCAKKENAKQQQGGFISVYPAEEYHVDNNQYPKLSSQATTRQPVADEIVTCAYDGKQIKKSAVKTCSVTLQTSLENTTKTYYFCTQDEMNLFMKNPEGYLSGKVKPESMK